MIIDSLGELNWPSDPGCDKDAHLAGAARTPANLKRFPLLLSEIRITFSPPPIWLTFLCRRSLV